MLERAALDVAIVGGGPAGLTAAAAVLRTRPELKVRVFERESKLRRVGNFVGVAVNGQRALKAIDAKVWEKVEQDLITVDEVLRGDFRTQKAYPIIAEARLIAWYNLRQGLSEILPSDCLKLGCKLQDLVQEDEGTAVPFMATNLHLKDVSDNPQHLGHVHIGVGLNFSSPEESYHAKVVIGCDGYRSQVREMLLQDGPPTFRKKICWRGVIDWPEHWPFPKSKVVFMKKDDASMATGPLDDEYLGWQAALVAEDEKGYSPPLSRSVQIAPSGDEYKKRCLDALEETLPEYVAKVLKDTPPERVTEHGLFARHPDSCGVWGKGSVTLLGDAAHVTTPYLGQGTSQAFMDAAELGRAIGELGPCDEALRQYEDVRIETVKRVQKGSWDVTDGLMEEREWLEQNPWCASQTVEPL